MKRENEEILEGFEERMRFINIVRRILNRTGKKEIDKMVPESWMMDTLIVAVLLYIKERTLGNDMLCSMGDIEGFLEDVTTELTGLEDVNYAELARYIVIVALQNDGEIKEYPVYNSARHETIPEAVRLLDEDKEHYRLTDDMFDFIFRSKEIESEIDYSVTRFKMKEYMKRNNYKEALSQSRELVSRIRNMRLSMNAFLQRSRENIASITVDEYEEILRRIRNLLDDEYEELVEIQKDAEERTQKLQEASHSGLTAEEMLAHRKALVSIIENISTTINEQRGLINQKSRLSDSYREIIEDSFTLSVHERMDFEQEIMAPLRRNGAALEDAAAFLLFPLISPSFANMFNVENFYSEQNAIRDEEEESGIDLSGMTADAGLVEQERNQRFRDIVRELFLYMKGKRKFTLEAFVESLPVGKLFDFCEENALPAVFMALYGEQIVDIRTWKEQTPVIVPPQGELDISWCLSELSENLLDMDRVEVRKLEEDCTFDIRKKDNARRIAMSNLELEVVR